MVIVNSVLLIAAYVLVSSWAYYRGRRMLVKCAVAFLAAILIAALILGFAMGVPSIPAFLLYAFVIGGPIVIMPTWLLLLLHSNIDRKANASAVGPVPVAVLGAAVGFVIGFMFTVIVFPTP